MSNQNEIELDEGQYECWGAQPEIKLVTVKGERKTIVTVAVRYQGDVITKDTWHTLDPRLTTATGKKRINFTIDALKALGAVDPMRDIALALKANPSAETATIEGLGSKMAVLAAKASGQFTNYNIWATREPAPASFVDELLSLSDGGKKAKAPAADVNPFAPRGKPVSPPPPKSEGDTSFTFGANVQPPPGEAAA